MEYRKLTNTDLNVSKICLGTMTFGEQNTEAESHQQLDFALDHGVNFIDTAELYAVPSRPETQGLSEKCIGTWIAKSGKRDKVIIATKATGPSPNLLHISKNLGYSKDRLEDALHKSLKRLQTDYIDIYQFHWPDRNTNMFSQRAYRHNDKERLKDNFLESMETVMKFKREGKIKYYGVSNETPWGMYKYLTEADKNGLERPVTVQNPYNLLNRLFEVGMSEISCKEGIDLLAYSPMAFGLLSGKYHKGIDNEEDRLNKFKQMARYNGDNAYRATAQYLALAEANGMTLAQMCLAFIISRPFLGGCIIGATNLVQLKENIESVHLKIGDDVIKEINRIQEAIPNPAP